MNILRLYKARKPTRQQAKGQALAKFNEQQNQPKQNPFSQQPAKR